MKESIEKRLAKIESQLTLKPNWTMTVTSIYRYNDVNYKSENPLEKNTLTIIGMSPGAI